jgi:hypothetical protein
MAGVENPFAAGGEYPAQWPRTARAASRYLTNTEAAQFLRLSPRTLEKQRVLGGGPRYRKFGRRVLYAVDDLESWANERSFTMTCELDDAAR